MEEVDASLYPKYSGELLAEMTVEEIPQEIGLPYMFFTGDVVNGRFYGTLPPSLTYARLSSDEHAIMGKP